MKALLSLLALLVSTSGWTAMTNNPVIEDGSRGVVPTTSTSAIHCDKRNPSPKILPEFDTIKEDTKETKSI